MHLAVAYYEQNGNLNMPRSYVTAAGGEAGLLGGKSAVGVPKRKADG